MTHPTRARAVRIHEFGTPDVIRFEEVPVLDPAPNELLVAIRAAGVNPVDIKIREGKRHTEPLTEPIGLGRDAAGTVVAVGADVSGFTVGDSVIGHDLSGAYAQYVTASAALFTRQPDGVSFEQGAALGIPVGTAYQVLISLGVESGATVLVHAGAGAVGQAAIQLARLRGARVVATASRRNHDRLRELGADPVEYGPGLEDRIRGVVPGGVDRVIDAAGTAEALEASLRLVGDPRHIGELVNVDWAEKYGVSAYSTIRPGFLDDAQRRLRAEAVPYAAGLLGRGQFVVEIAASLPLEQAAEAQRLLSSGKLRGKIVLTS